MTTIAFRAGVLAADSQITFDGAKYDTDYQKIFKGAKEDILAGSTGDVAMGTAFMKWALSSNFETVPELKDLDLGKKGSQVTGIIIINCSNDKYNLRKKRPRYQVIEYNGGGVIDFKCPEFLAWGSGWQFAMGAMEHGASAAEAVEIAARRDIHTSGKVQVLSFNTPTARKAKR